MNSDKSLLISSGKLSEDDTAWDIEFWQSVSFLERVKIARQMVIDSFKMRERKDLPIPTIERSFVQTGKLII